MTMAQWQAKVSSMTAEELKAQIEALETQLADMDTDDPTWPKSFEYHARLQQKRECITALASLEAADTAVQLALPLKGETQC